MSDREPLHPNLADALGPDAVDGAELDAIARLLADSAPIEDAPPAPAGLAERVRAAVAAEPLVEPMSQRAGAEVVELSARRRRRWLPAVGVAAAAAVAAVVVGVAVSGDGSDEPRRQEVELAALPGFEDGTGVATLELGDDERSLAVDLAGVEVPAGSHLELWLLDPDVTELVALGEVTGPGPHQLPSDVDLSRTPIVDVSLEPTDGDPTHSGVSVLRGEVEPA